MASSNGFLNITNLAKFLIRGHIISLPPFIPEVQSFRLLCLTSGDPNKAMIVFTSAWVKAFIGLSYIAMIGTYLTKNSWRFLP